MNDLPEPDFKSEDADKLIRDYRIPLDPERRKELTDKLEAVRAKFKQADSGKESEGNEEQER